MMTGDPVKTMPLPSGPASLCFEKDDFMKDDFNVDQFVLEHRRTIQLEDLRDGLSVYLKILRSAMIELINKDYADFVNLSSNLVGMDKAIGSLTGPLNQLKDDVTTVRTSMDEAIQAVEEKLKQRQQIKQKKTCLQRLMNITQSVEKIERLLGIQHTSGTSDTPHRAEQLNGQLIERVATEFNKLQFYVTKSKGLPLVEQIKPRISNITTTLQYSLEGSFLEGLDTGNADILRQCLRTYALIDKIKDAEKLFRQHIVKPYMDEFVTEQFIKSNQNGVKGMLNKVLHFIPTHCKVLTDVTAGVGASAVVRGYDFLVNAVWPEVVSSIEARTSSIFAPGNPNVFHNKFLLSMQFLDQFERQCGSQASVKRLREHACYHTFINKWSLPVYFQIRFQEIAGGFEGSLFSPFNKATDQSTFHLNSTHCLWTSLHKCWADDIFLKPLSHRFWKLSMQLLMRYSTWLEEAYKDQIIDRKDVLPEPKPKPSTGRLTPNTTESPGTPTERLSSSPVPLSPPITMGQILGLLADADKLMCMLPGYLEKTVYPRFDSLDEKVKDSFTDCIAACCSAIREQLPLFHNYVVLDVTAQCSVHLKQVNDIPRLYRRTKRDVPSKPSQYISSVVKPLNMFVEEHSDILGQHQGGVIFKHAFSALADQYYSITSDVLTSVKKMEDSLKRLKKGRGTDKSSGSQGLSDDDKIRHQLILDIMHYGEQMESFGIKQNTLEPYKKLLKLAEEAKSAMTTVSGSSS